jgi:hypothetical protein
MMDKTHVNGLQDEQLETTHLWVFILCMETSARNGGDYCESLG